MSKYCLIHTNISHNNIWNRRLVTMATNIPVIEKKETKSNLSYHEANQQSSRAASNEWPQDGIIKTKVNKH